MESGRPDMAVVQEKSRADEDFDWWQKKWQEVGILWR